MTDIETPIPHYQKYKETVKKSVAKWQREHKEEKNAYNREYHKADPERHQRRLDNMKVYRLRKLAEKKEQAEKEKAEKAEKAEKPTGLSFKHFQTEIVIEDREMDKDIGFKDGDLCVDY